MRSRTESGRLQPCAFPLTICLRVAPLHLVVLAVLAVPTLALGLFWGSFKDLADQAIRHFLDGDRIVHRLLDLRLDIAGVVQ